MGNGQKIVRPREGRKIAGVCQALANFFGLDVNIIRIGCIVGWYRTLGIPYLLVGNTRGG